MALEPHGSIIIALEQYDYMALELHVTLGLNVTLGLYVALVLYGSRTTWL